LTFGVCRQKSNDGESFAFRVAKIGKKGLGTKIK
jgi:hypothetical protein